MRPTVTPPSMPTSLQGNEHSEEACQALGFLRVLGTPGFCEAALCSLALMAHLVLICVCSKRYLQDLPSSQNATLFLLPILNALCMSLPGLQ